MAYRLFVAKDNTVVNAGLELYVTDGTAAGTLLLKDINAGPGDSSAANFVLNGAKTYFTATDGVHGVQEWVTDGTVAGTIRLDATAGTGAYTNPKGLTNFGAKEIFIATDATAANTGTELYITDGTAAGTTLLKDISAGPGSSAPSDFFVSGAQLYFTADDGVHGRQKWVTDGTSAGTVRLDPLPASGTGSYNNAILFNRVAGIGFFVATDTTATNTGTELYITNGTAAGTQLLKDIFAGAGSSNPENFVANAGKLYFTANDGVHGVEEWVTDGTAAGTIRLDAAPASSAASYSNPGYMFNVGAKEVFTATDTTAVNGGTELYVTDGTAAGTTLLKDINVGPGSSNPSNFLSAGGGLLFTADDGVHGRQEYFTNGTAAGTVRLDSAPGSSPASYTNPNAYYIGGAYALFSATDATVTNAGTELYATDGTAAGTVLLKDINPGPTSSNPGNFVRNGAKTYFTANDGVHGVEEWVTDGTAAGTIRLDPLPPGSTASYSNPTQLLNLNGAQELFVATDNTATNLGAELWVTDGTAAGTKLLKDISPGPGSSNPSNFLVTAGKAYFTATDGVHGIEEWVTDGTLAGTIRLDQQPPANPASYTTPAAAPGTVYSIAALAASKLDSATLETQLTFTVSRTGDVSGAEILAYSIAGSGASPAIAADFVSRALPSGTIVFAGGESSKVITLNVLPNSTVHADQTFSVNLFSDDSSLLASHNSALGTSMASGAILSNKKPAASANFTILNTTTGTPTTSAGVPYTGPVAGLMHEFIYTGSDNYNVTANSPNNFIHTGSGFDAIDVRNVGGTNVLDGGTNSNFLVGGIGAGSNDTFFVDDRSPPSDIWSTVGNFHAGDSATVFGITQNGFSTNFVDGEGAVGYTGVTLHVTAPGVPTASLTLAGYSVADLSNGRLTTSFGTETDGTPYFFIHANS